MQLDNPTRPLEGEGVAVEPLRREQIALAYPLIRILKPAISLDQWRDYARATIHAREDGRTGAKVAVNSRGHIFGLFTWRREPDLEYGCRLAVENFVALEVVAAPIVGAALVEAIEREAVHQGCAAVRTALPGAIVRPKPGTGARYLALFDEAGHTVENFNLRKTLRPARLH